MNTRQVEAISKLLRESREAPPAREAPATRARAIDALEAVLRARAARRRRVRVLWGGGAAAAATVALLVGMKLASHHGANANTTAAAQTQAQPPAGGAAATNAEGTPAHPTEHAEQGLALADGSILQPGSRIVAPAQRRALVTFSSGTQLTVAGGGDITVVEAGDVQRFLLSSGTIDAHVAKLHSGQRWLVTTPDAEVEVRGTAFEVSIVPPDPSCGDGTRTRVSVREGVVSVRSHDVEVRVHPGEVWPAGCHHVASSNNTTSAGASTEGPLLSVASPTTPPNEATQPANVSNLANFSNGTNNGSSVAAHSTLAEQNDGFARIVALRQRGEMTGCASEADRFLARFPQSPLAESARVEQLRALRVADPVRAAAAAKQYLAQYPNGFARVEAQAIASQRSTRE